MIGPPSYPTKTSPGEGLVRFLSVRLIVSLIIAVAGVSLLFSYHQVAVEKRGLKRDLSKRAEVLAESLQDSVEPLLEKKSHKPLQRIVERFGNREHLTGVAIYGDHSEVLAASSAIPAELMSQISVVREAIVRDRKSTRLNSSHRCISYAVFCLKKKTTESKNHAQTH